MKIAVCSDLHLEFGNIVLKNDGADVLILSGDILVERDLDMYDRRQVEYGFDRKRSTMFHEFFEQVCSEFPHVIYVAGNHEHYHGDYAITLNELKRKLARFENLHVLDRESFVLNDVTFLGGTLWTNMNNRDPLTLYHMKSMLNEFRCVMNSNRKVSFRAELPDPHNPGKSIVQFKQRDAVFSPEDAADDFDKCFGYIKEVTSDADRKFVVVTHHTPSFQSCHPMYVHDTIMNGGYHSELGEFIADRPQIKLWTHGHTHEVFDYMINETRVVCNPRGYHNYEQRASDFQLKFVVI